MLKLQRHRSIGRRSNNDKTINSLIHQKLVQNKHLIGIIQKILYSILINYSQVTLLKLFLLRIAKKIPSILPLFVFNFKTREFSDIYYKRRKTPVFNNCYFNSASLPLSFF